jgi:hypothetical protein
MEPTPTMDDAVKEYIDSIPTEYLPLSDRVDRLASHPAAGDLRQLLASQKKENSTLSASWR